MWCQKAGTSVVPLHCATFLLFFALNCRCLDVFSCSCIYSGAVVAAKWIYFFLKSGAIVTYPDLRSHQVPEVFNWAQVFKVSVVFSLSMPFELNLCLTHCKDDRRPTRRWVKRKWRWRRLYLVDAIREQRVWKLLKRLHRFSLRWQLGQYRASEKQYRFKSL